MMDRWVEDGLLDVLEKKGVGAIAFSPLEQGILSDKYLKGFPKDSRAVKDGRYLKTSHLTEEVIGKVSALNDIALSRDQSLAQMAVAWLLKDDRVTSVLVGVSKKEQLLENIKATANVKFSKKEKTVIMNILKS